MHARSLVALSALVALTACDPGTSVPADCTIAVSPSADDSRTVAEAIVGLGNDETFCFLPGTYHFTDPVEFRDVTRLTVRGTGGSRGDVVLDFSTQTGGAKGLSFTAVNELVVENMTVLDAPGDNLFATNGTGITFRNLASGWMNRAPAGRYAVYPVESTNVLLDDVLAFGSADAGIYVGQTTNCIVRNSEARGNVAGIEIENSTNCEVYGNSAHDNTGGVLIFELPGLPHRGSGTSVHDNLIENNNIANFAEPGTIVAILPPGTGVMLLAANDVELTGNTINGNVSFGAFLISYDTAVVGGAPSPMDAGYDGYLETMWIHDNVWSANGTDPMGDAGTIIAGASGVTRLEDMIWDGFLAAGATPDTLCIDEPTGTFRNVDVPGNFLNTSTDVTPHACTGTARPAVVFP